MDRVWTMLVTSLCLAAAGCGGSSGGKCADAPCAQSGVSECADGRIRACEQDAEGCLAWSAYEGCASGTCLDATACLVCDDTCADGASECAEGRVRACVRDPDGCPAWGAYTDCASGFCGDVSTCGECADPCTAGQTECSGGLLRACEVDQHGCLVWGASTACPDGFCADDATCGTCDNTCTPGESECTAGQLRTCGQDANGCWAMGPFADCADGFCADPFTCGVCDHGCPSEGATQCANAEQSTCVADGDGCLDWGPPTACDLGLCASSALCAWLQQEEWVVISDDGAAGEAFGDAVDLFGDTLVVGATRNDNANGTDAGAAYVFARDQGCADCWGQVAKPIAADGVGGQGFGASVAIDGDTVVVGAPYDAEQGLQAGAAYVFERDVGCAGCWGQVTKLLAEDGGEYDAFGWSVAISGDTIAVGAVFDGVFGQGTGTVYVFDRDAGGPGAWGQARKIPNSSPSQDYMGNAVAISGDTLVAGAYHDDEIDTNAGAAHVFERDQGGPGNWGLVAKLLAADGAHGDEFGGAVAIDGDTVVIGAREHQAGLFESGAAYLFGRDQGGPGAWGQEDKLLPDDAEDRLLFGHAVAVAGAHAFIGARPQGGGAAYLFERLQPGPDAWAQAIRLSTSVLFGSAVAADASLLAVAAPGDSNVNGAGAGAVYVYRVFP